MPQPCHTAARGAPQHDAAHLGHPDRRTPNNTATAPPGDTVAGWDSHATVVVALRALAGRPFVGVCAVHRLVVEILVERLVVIGQQPERRRIALPVLAGVVE